MWYNTAFVGQEYTTTSEYDIYICGVLWTTFLRFIEFS